MSTREGSFLVMFSNVLEKGREEGTRLTWHYLFSLWDVPKL